MNWRINELRTSSRWSWLAVATLGLVGWEFLQRTGNLVFDPADIVATLVGAVAVGILFRVLPGEDHSPAPGPAGDAPLSPSDLHDSQH